ncbi:MAG TPA: hypothetical protein VES88_02300 [Gemmatimonadaceae bacterium]|nr:hypothetical protein [Gemmatimonadaceae bacterium]
MESPVSFVRREWQALTVFGGVFVIVLLIGVLAVDPAYFYPRLQTDPLLYWLKGLAFAETGHTVARTAINRVPFNYVAMPGVMRAPFMMMFSDFDNQLRAIQLSNIVLLLIIAVMFAYVLSWALPRSRHWIAIGFTFGFLLINPNWVANVFAPLADAPYAAFTLGVIILATRLLTSDRPFGRRALAIAGVAALFAMAFLVKFTAPVLAVYAGVLAAGRPRSHALPRRVKVLTGLGAIAAVAVLIALNWGPLVNRYLPEPFIFLRRASKTGMLLNLMGVALPSSIIPVYHLAFAQYPITKGAFNPAFGATMGDMAITAAGVGISLVLMYGMWRARRRFMPEILYFLAALPVLTVMIPSTRRYLMPYQPFIWIFFYVGAAALLEPVTRRLRPVRVPAIVSVGLAGALVLGLLFLRSQRVAGTTVDRGAAISIGQTRGYVGEVVSTFGDLRRYLETLPRDRSLLIGGPGEGGRWKAIAGLDYYHADSTLAVAARQYDIYVLVECGTVDVCQDFESWDSRFRKRIDSVGPFAYERVFSRSTERAKARVYRLRNPQ